MHKADNLRHPPQQTTIAIALKLHHSKDHITILYHLLRINPSRLLQRKYIPLQFQKRIFSQWSWAGQLTWNILMLITNNRSQLLEYGTYKFGLYFYSAYEFSAVPVIKCQATYWPHSEEEPAIDACVCIRKPWNYQIQVRMLHLIFLNVSMQSLKKWTKESHGWHGNIFYLQFLDPSICSKDV